ncbi:MAG TPA: hypothetical protein PKZ07_14755 [Sedimentisphaerales bacterium]|nr:hypothetical protein [Sedimentisphaerales bacterium]
MAAKTPRLVCKKGRDGQYYTSLVSRNGKKEMSLGEGYKRPFTEKMRATLIRDLIAAELVIVRAAAKPASAKSNPVPKKK